MSHRDITQTRTAGERGAKVLELNVTIIEGEVQTCERRRAVEAVEAVEAAEAMRD